MNHARFLSNALIVLAGLIPAAAGAAGEIWSHPEFSRAYTSQRADIGQSRADQIRQGLQATIEKVAAEPSQMNTTSTAAQVALFERRLLQHLQGRRCRPGAPGNTIAEASDGVLKAAKDSGLKVSPRACGQLTALVVTLLERTRAQLCKALTLDELAS